MDEKKDGDGRLAPRPLRPAERPSVRCHWLSWWGPPPSPPPSQPAVGAAINLALTHTAADALLCRSTSIDTSPVYRRSTIDEW